MLQKQNQSLLLGGKHYLNVAIQPAERFLFNHLSSKNTHTLISRYATHPHYELEYIVIGSKGFETGELKRALETHRNDLEIDSVGNAQPQPHTLWGLYA